MTGNEQMKSLLKKDADNILAKQVLDSPALRHKSNLYPTFYDGKTPLLVRMKETVRQDLPFGPPITVMIGERYYVWVNSHGAVSAVFANGEQLGLKPSEFEVLEFHEDEIPNT